MGGSGSGRRHTRRAAVEDCLALPLRALRRDGVLRPGWDGVWRWPRGQRIGIECSQARDADLSLRLSFTATRNGQSDSVTQDAAIVWVPLFAGMRPWLTCPLCGSRRASILLPSCVTRFGCRGCYGLSYRSVQEHDARVDRLRRLLPPDAPPLDIDAPGLSFVRFRADWLGPLVRRDPRRPRRRVERPLDMYIHSSYDDGHAEPPDETDRVALPRLPLGGTRRQGEARRNKPDSRARDGGSAGAGHKRQRRGRAGRAPP